MAIPSFILLKNMPVSIRFTNAINVVGATLNISSTGAKPLFIQGAALQAGLVKGGCTVTVIYDGTNWNIVGIEGLEQPAGRTATCGWTRDCPADVCGPIATST